MATPQSTASDEVAANDKNEQITFRFCSECSNMLYPKEDVDAHKLQYTCRTCQYTEDAHSHCVFRNNLDTNAGETAGVTQDVGSDPTVSELPPVLCMGCGGVIYCTFCAEPDSEMIITSTKKPAQESMGMCQFVLPMMPWDEDPFSEYDEEMMIDEPADADSQSDSADEFCQDGAMKVGLWQLAAACDASFWRDCGSGQSWGFARPLDLLPRSNKTCPVCSHEEAVFFQSQQRSAETGMKLFYVCCECGNIFT
ncbi:RNA polymerase M/15 kDa subunit [Dactylonectria macrodidyma]|uniref:DNA-directed RNA polymerase II subunit RPB9 n=1 Tax=Dactylonectria macrodidyma TaxID=307937 RepID=A0A9P9FMJ2_9HYPO|nr:RNA polymerase M/15 kDa subunit [Dactylonectria macrodidyma]